MGMQWASDCSTTTDPMLSQCFPTDTLLLVPIYAPHNLCLLKKERERVLGSEKECVYGRVYVCQSVSLFPNDCFVLHG